MRNSSWVVLYLALFQFINTMLHCMVWYGGSSASVLVVVGWLALAICFATVADAADGLILMMICIDGSG